MPDHPSWPAELVEKGHGYTIEVCDTCGQHVMESPHFTGPCQNGPTHWVEVVPVSALSGDLVPREEHEAEVERLRGQNKAAAELRDRDEADLRARCARYENAWSSARENVKSIPADWTNDPPSQEEYGLWRYSSVNTRHALTFLAGQADALAEALEEIRPVFERLLREAGWVDPHLLALIDSRLASYRSKPAPGETK